MKETSKQMLFWVLIYCGVALTVILIMWACGTAGAPAMASIYSAPAAVVIGFYEWKARGENLMKVKELGLSDSVLKQYIRHKATTNTESTIDDDDIAG